MAVRATHGAATATAQVAGAGAGSGGMAIGALKRRYAARYAAVHGGDRRRNRCSKKREVTAFVRRFWRRTVQARRERSARGARSGGNSRKKVVRKPMPAVPSVSLR